MQSDVFKKELEEFNKQKKEIEEAAKKQIRDLAKQYEESADKAGYTFDEKAQCFEQRLINVMEVILSCQGENKYPSPKVLVHRLNELEDSKFSSYISCFDGTYPGEPFSVISRKNIVEVTKNIASCNPDFFNAFSNCFKQCHLNGKEQVEILLEQGLNIYKYPRLFAKDCRTYTFTSEYNIVDYYGGFEYYLPNIQCEIHFYTVSKNSFEKMQGHLTPGVFSECRSLVHVADDNITYPSR